MTLLEGKEIDFDNIKINFEKEKKMLQNYKNFNNIEPVVIHIQSNNNLTTNSFEEWNYSIYKNFKFVLFEIFN